MVILLRGLLALAAATVVLAGGASADPEKIAAGLAQLPTSGLVVDLAPAPGVTYSVSGRWGFDRAGLVYAHDIVDELDEDGDIITGNWVSVEYLDDSDCDVALAEEDLARSWTESVSLWGQDWRVRGGVYNFESRLGRRPAAFLCRMNALTGRTIMLAHFLVDQPAGAGERTVMRSVLNSTVLAAFARSYEGARAIAITPTRRPEVVADAGSSPTRTLVLPATGLVLDLPDDGFVWLPQALEKGAASDLIDRVLPAMPEATLEVARLRAVACADALAQVKGDVRPDVAATDAPDGWIAGPALAIDADLQFPLCHAAPGGVLLVGVLQPRWAADTRNLRPFRPMLDALLAAANRG